MLYHSVQVDIFSCKWILKTQRIFYSDDLTTGCVTVRELHGAKSVRK